jgi:competence protein ComEC
MTYPRPPHQSSHLPAPAFRLALHFGSGILLGAYSGLETHVWGCLSLALCLAAAVGLWRGGPRGVFLSLLGGLLLISAGAFRYSIDSPPPVRLPDPSSPRNVRLSGEVCSPPEEKWGNTTFTLISDSCSLGARSFPLRLRIAVTLRRMRAERSARRIAYGMNVLLQGLISAPPVERNPGEFSPRRYFESHGISGVLSVEDPAGVLVRDTSGGCPFLKRCVFPVRSALLRRVGEILPGVEGEFLKDLLLGERSGIPGETREAFIDAGVAHVLAVSGYRVLVLSALLAGMLNLLRVPRSVFPFLAAPSLLFYMALVLAQPPVVRGTVMALVLMLGRAMGRRTSPQNSLGVAALLLLLEDTRQLFDTGFQLSFGAVVSLQAFMPGMQSFLAAPSRSGLVSAARIRIIRSVAVSLIVSLGTLPILAACFGRVSLVGLVTNIVVVPATGLAMMLGALSLAGGALGGLIGAAYGALDCLLLRATIRFSEFAASIPLASIGTGNFTLIEAIAWYSLLGCIFWRGNRRVMARCIVLLLAALNALLLRSFSRGPEHAGGLLRLSVIDVGQGDAILVEFPRGETLLVDAGPLSRGADAGKRIVVPFLRRRGIRELDLLVITHPDADHAGGAASVIRAFPVRRLIETAFEAGTGVEGSYHAAARERGTRFEQAWRGENLEAEKCARLYVLWPPRHQGAPWRRGSSNNSSVVLRLVYGEVSFLLTGDAERDPEAAMVRSFGGFLRSTVLKVAHHGSESGTSQEFIDLVRPSLALISVGVRNRFGHPSRTILDRLRTSGTPVRRTDRQGAILLATDGKRVEEVVWK